MNPGTFYRFHDIQRKFKFPTYSVWLLIIILLGAALRLLFLDKAPNTFSLDEVSNAYDAYSILETGRDRYGNPWPVFFRGLNDDREGLYIYLMVPLIKFFGLNEFSARLCSGIISILTIPAISYLEKQPNECVYISDNFGLPYLYIIFYTKYSPKIFQETPLDPRLKTDYSINKYEVLNIINQEDLKSYCLVVERADDVKDLLKVHKNLQPIKTISLPNGKKKIVIFSQSS